MNIVINITADPVADRDVLARLFAALAPQATHTVVAVPVAAPPAPPKIEAVPAPPLSPAVKAGLERAEAEAPPKKKVGRPTNAELAARKAAEKAKEWAPPVPRPESGIYGKQEPDPKDNTWEQKRAEARQRLKVVLTALNTAGLDHQKFLSYLMTRYGDGKMLSTVPQGNLEAMVTEAEEGPEEHRLTKKELEAAAAQLEAEAGAS